MAQQEHIIKRQIIELDVPPNMGNFQLQQKVETWMEQMVLPKLDQLFNELLPADRYLEIDQLEIDLGSIELTTFDQALADHYLEEIRRSIEEKIHLATFQADEQTKWQTNENTWMETFLHFLQTGTFPWWKPAVRMEKFERELRQAFRNNPRLVQSRVFVLLSSVPKTCSRLVQQFSESFIQQLLNIGHQRLSQQYLDYNKFFVLLTKSIPKQNRSFDLKVSEVQAAIIRVLSKELAATNRAHYWIENILQQISHFNKSVAYSELLQSFHLVTQDPKIRQELNLISTTSAAFIREIEQLAKTETSVKSAETATNISEQIATIETTLIGEQAGHYIDNAGLVLTAPFLPTFFKTLGLLDGKKFKDNDDAERAMHILQYLVSPQEQNPEYLLVLNKILCGIPINQPVSNNIEITKSEKEEVQQLLQSMINHWKALKKTSPSGLQEGFIQRAGKLTFKEENNAWLLQVEQQSMDILLSSIPWSYSVVKLPWLPDLLRVEWA